MSATCKDCKYYLSIDVFKALCKITKDRITPDTKECEKFEANPKCKLCANYASSDEDEWLGTCMGKAVASPDMNAQYCADYKK